VGFRLGHHIAVQPFAFFWAQPFGMSPSEDRLWERIPRGGRASFSRLEDLDASGWVFAIFRICPGSPDLSVEAGSLPVIGLRCGVPGFASGLWQQILFSMFTSKRRSRSVGSGGVRFAHLAGFSLSGFPASLSFPRFTGRLSDRRWLSQL
jgi:hypothetical protein